jgi:hypothetical protein
MQSAKKSINQTNKTPIKETNEKSLFTVVRNTLSNGNPEYLRTGNVYPNRAVTLVPVNTNNNGPNIPTPDDYLEYNLPPLTDITKQNTGKNLPPLTTNNEDKKKQETKPKTTTKSPDAAPKRRRGRKAKVQNNNGVNVNQNTNTATQKKDDVYIPFKFNNLLDYSQFPELNQESFIQNITQYL